MTVPRSACSTASRPSWTGRLAARGCWLYQLVAGGSPEALRSVRVLESVPDGEPEGPVALRSSRAAPSSRMARCGILVMSTTERFPAPSGKGSREGLLPALFVFDKQMPGRRAARCVRATEAGNGSSLCHSRMPSAFDTGVGPRDRLLTRRQMVLLVGTSSRPCGTPRGYRKVSRRDTTCGGEPPDSCRWCGA